MTVGVCTILTQDMVEYVLGKGSFYVFQVVTLVVVNTFCFDETKSMDLGHEITFHSIPGNLTIDGFELPENMDINELRIFFEAYVQSNDLKVWRIPSGDINLKKGSEEKIAQHTKAKPMKERLSRVFKSTGQDAAQTKHVLALNCVPNTMAFPMLVAVVLYVLASDGTKLLFTDVATGNVQLYTVEVWRIFKDIKSNALNGVTAPVEVVTPALNPTSPTMPHTPANRPVVSAPGLAEDAVNKENHEEPPLETNATHEVQDSDNTVMLAVGTAVTSGFGGFLYWVFTQG